MESALRNRLTFGPMMLAGLGVILWVDHAAEGWTRSWMLREHGVDRGVCGVGLLGFLLLVTLLGTIELATLFTAERVRPYRSIAVLGSWGILIHAFLTQFPAFQPIAASCLAFIVVFTMLFAALRHAWHKQPQDAIGRMAGTLLATMYLGALTWFLLALRVKKSDNVIGTTMLILMILLVVKFTDIGAYFGGRRFGKHKLIPWLSPGKTWEGLVFGMLTAGVVGALCAAAIPYRVDGLKGFIFGVILGGIGQLGDLLESLMKRDAQVKDSGASIPGFGGVLDVIDSPLLAAPFAYLLFSVF